MLSRRSLPLALGHFRKVVSIVSRVRQSLLISGALLFLIGLLSGVFISHMRNPRMGLSAHLAGVQNALFLLVAGALWERVTLGRRLKTVLAWSGILGMYGFWVALQLAAVWGTSRGTPIAGAGFEAVEWQESFVANLLRVSSGLSILATALLLGGFVRGRRVPTNTT